MSYALSWLAAAAGVAVSGTTRASSPAGRPRVRHRSRDLRRRPTLNWWAAVVTGVLCVAALGVPTGVLIAAVACPAAAAAVRRLASSPGAVSSADGLAFALDLAAAVLRSGAPVSVALELAAPAVSEPASTAFVQVGGMLRLGAGPVEAWHVVENDPRLGVVARVSRRSSDSGVRLAGAWEQLAADLRAESRAAALARANRAGVYAMAPLGLCFLPAFVCLGVVPDVLGVARGVLGSGP